MNVDRARQRNPVDRQLLIMSPPRRQTGKKNPDDGDKANDKTQPNHAPYPEIKRIKPFATLAGLTMNNSAPP